MAGDMRSAEKSAPTEISARGAAGQIGAAAARAGDPTAGSLERQPSGQQITLDQLSPEAIDAIARRAVEHLSARVVEEVAWEVVPQLAELLIKRRLEEEKPRTQ